MIVFSPQKYCKNPPRHRLLHLSSVHFGFSFNTPSIFNTSVSIMGRIGDGDVHTAYVEFRAKESDKVSRNTPLPAFTAPCILEACCDRRAFIPESLRTD